MTQSLLIVGGTARAAATSARRAGLAPAAIDRYGDTDLRRVCHEHHCIQHFSELPQRAERLAGTPWLFTGPLENYPQVIEALARESPLLGCSLDAVQSIRDPVRLAAEARSAGFNVPQVVGPPQVAGDDGQSCPGPWLHKPVRSSGGVGITREPAAPARSDSRPGPFYRQQSIDGVSAGATFVADGRSATLLGVCEQLVGESWTGAKDFQYSGSIGPLHLAAPRRAEFVRLGNWLANTFELRGLFGADVVLNAQGVWLIEVNPRYTASIELMERACHFFSIKLHIDACRDARLPNPFPEMGRSVHGKAIVYAEERTEVTGACNRALLDLREATPWPGVADIPEKGTTLGIGAPVVTVFAEGASVERVKSRLRARVRRVRTMIGC